MVWIAQSLCSQTLYPKTSINPATGDTIVTFTAKQVFSLTDTLTKLLDSYTECRLGRDIMDSMLISANKYITSQEATIKAYNDLKPIYESLVISNDSIQATYDREIVFMAQILKLHKEKNTARWVTTILVILGIAGAAFAIGYFVAK